MPDESFLQNNQKIGNYEVFRLREERKRKKNLAQQASVSSMPGNDKIIQLGVQQGLGLSAANKVKMGIEFVEVLSSTEKEEENHAQFEIELKSIEKKVNKTDSPEANAALKAAIEYLEEKNETVGLGEVQKQNWGIFNYFYNDQKCDYQKASSLENGQDYYRKRGDSDTAMIFVANGEVTRSKGDQVAIETCTGKALMDGNLK